MNATERPVSVLVIACVYLAVGIIGFSYHFPELLAARRDSIWVELVELLAVLSGAFMLRGKNWARWLALAWMGFHVVISFHAPAALAIHSLLFAVIAWFLLRAEANRYFRRRSAPP